MTSLPHPEPHAPGVDIDDIAQASFVAAYSRLEEYTADTNFTAWLFTIARYQLQTETTRLRRIADYHSRYAPDLLARELERRTAAPAGEQDDRLGFLKDCLEAIDGTRRQFLVWRYDEAIPLAEMAARRRRRLIGSPTRLPDLCPRSRRPTRWWPSSRSPRRKPTCSTRPQKPAS